MKYYRVINYDVLLRAPLNGLHGNLDTQRTSVDGKRVIVERREGYAINKRWVTHAEALAIVAGPDWSEDDTEV